ncbi:hypothetical protein L0244_40180, partial [bacterium]|nr:hypothetical protein [bacterium]
MIGKISEEEYLDFNRLFHRKIEKAMKRLDGQIKPAFQFKNYAYRVSRVLPKSPTIWSAFYFLDGEKTHVNEYPSINFAYRENGLQLALNAETQPSVKKFVSFIKKKPNEFDKLAKELRDFYFSLHYKYHYFPQNQFIWNFVPGYPKEMPTFKAEEALSTMKNFERHWRDYTNTLLFEMKTGMRKHSSGQPFSEKELEFAQSRNPKPHYVIRIAKRYSSDDVEKLKDGIVTFLKAEVLKLRDLVESILH